MHDDLGRAALEVWGWDDLTPALMSRHGATSPSDLKTPEQEEAEDTLLAHLVALNAERRAASAGSAQPITAPASAPASLARASKRSSTWASPPACPNPAPGPEEPRAQFGAVRDLLDSAESPLSAEDVARAFKGRLSPTRRRRVQEVLAIMADLGIARYGQNAKLYAPRR
ncbi:hypothetical protein [Rubellimicrobium mesophilum]|uniref:hypothetical protein n=1 Tax=Rubellimicrobium mesophilum TaxID=1123067 RepID=UPI0012E1A45D|nr:hypothetical protein [Rubellimicrobium mesophilum]